MNFSINKVLILTVVGAGVFWFLHSERRISSVDATLAQKEQRLGEGLESPGGDPLSNNASTLKSLVISNKQIQNQLREKDTEINHLNDKIDSMTKSQNNSDVSIVANMQMRLKELLAQQQQTNAELEKLKSNQTQTPNSSSVDQTAGMVDTGIAPIEVTPIEDQSSNSDTSGLINQFVQPAIVQATNQLNNAMDVQPSNDGLVWITQNDRTEIKNDKGESTIVYAKTFDTKTTASEGSAQTTPDNGLSDETNSVLGNTDAKTEEKTIPIYTIPPNATFFGTVGMSAIIGRVPVDNQLQNAFRFKVLVGSDNLASNGHYIPNLESMSLSGYAEGDFTLECARGTIDTALFTFRDGTVRVVKGNELGHISDKYGVPCIAGQYITNFPDYVTKKSGLAMLSSAAASLSEAATSVSTTDSGVTTTVVNNAAQKALGDGASSAATEVSEWFEQRQSSAFDVVFIKTGAPLVVNIDDFINIDYEPNGRKLYHRKNAKEYKL